MVEEGEDAMTIVVMRVSRESRVGRFLWYISGQQIRYFGKQEDL